MASDIRVAERTTPSAETMASSTRCRSALLRATTRQSMSPAPVMVCTSSIFGIAASRGRYLADLEGDERGHLVAERGRIHLGSGPGDHPALLHPLQPRLYGTAGDAQAAGGLEHADPRLGGQQSDQRGVKSVDQPAITDSHAVQGDTIVRSVLIDKMTNEMTVGCAL